MNTAIADPIVGQARPIRNAMTVDVEDYFQVSAFADVVKRDDWDKMEDRVEANTGRVLDLFDLDSPLVRRWSGVKAPAED